MEIPTNTMLVITPKMNVLQIPIVDEFHVPSSDPASRARTTAFASEKGFLSPRPPEPNGDAKKKATLEPVPPVAL